MAKLLGRGVVDWPSILLIDLYIVISLVIGLLITKFPNYKLDIDRLDSITEISSVMLGVSITFCTVIFSLLTANNKNNVKKMLPSFLVSLHPIFCSLASLVFPTILLKCFYEGCATFTVALCQVSFIACVLSAPYYLLSSIHFLFRSFETIKQDS